MLNSCSGAQAAAADVFSSTAASLVRTGVSAVVAMQFAVSDPAAKAFAAGFYQAIAHNRSIAEAVRIGRIGIRGTSEKTLEWITPVLYLRGDDAALFEVERGADDGSGAGSELSPEDAAREAAVPALYQQAMSKFRAGDFAGALGLFDNLLSDRDDFRDAASRRERAAQEVRVAEAYDEARDAEDDGDWSAAVEGYAAVLRLDPHHRHAEARARPVPAPAAGRLPAGGAPGARSRRGLARRGGRRRRAAPRVPGRQRSRRARVPGAVPDGRRRARAAAAGRGGGDRQRLAEEEAERERQRLAEEEAERERQRLAAEEAEKKRLAELQAARERQRLADKKERERLAEEAERQRQEEEAERQRQEEERRRRRRALLLYVVAPAAVLLLVGGAAAVFWPEDGGNGGSAGDGGTTQQEDAARTVRVRGPLEHGLALLRARASARSPESSDDAPLAWDLPRTELLKCTQSDESYSGTFLCAADESDFETIRGAFLGEAVGDTEEVTDPPAGRDEPYPFQVAFHHDGIGAGRVFWDDVGALCSAELQTKETDLEVVLGYWVGG